MKATGIVRKIDDLGRIVIPRELRRTLGMEIGDSLEIYVDADRVILKKYEPACVFCGSMDNIEHFKGKIVCGSCREDLGMIGLFKKAV